MKKTEIWKKVSVGALALCLTTVCCIESNMGFIAGSQAYADERTDSEQTSLEEEKQSANASDDANAEETKQDDKLNVDGNNAAEDDISLATEQASAPTSAAETTPKVPAATSNSIDPKTFKEDIGANEGELFATLEESTGNFIVSGKDNAKIDKSKFHQAIRKAMPYKSEVQNRKLIIKTDIAFPIDSDDMFFIEEGEKNNIMPYAIDIQGNVDTSEVETMACMFDKCKIENIDFSKWDTRNVVDISSMFYYTEGEKLDLSNWNLPQLEDMSNTFNHCKIKEIDLSNWKLDSMGKYFSGGMNFTFSDVENAIIDLSTWTGSNLDNNDTANSFMNTSVINFKMDMFENTYVSPLKNTYSIIAKGSQINNNPLHKITLRPGVHYIYKYDSDSKLYKLSHGLNYFANDNYNKAEKAKGNFDIVNDFSSEHYTFDDNEEYMISTFKPVPMVFATFAGNKYDLGFDKPSDEMANEEKVKYDNFDSFKIESIDKVNYDYPQNMSKEDKAKLDIEVNEFVEDFNKGKIKTFKLPADGKFTLETKSSFNGDKAVPMDIVINASAVPVSNGMTIKKGDKLDAKALAASFGELPEGVVLESFEKINTDVPGIYSVKAKLSGIDEDVIIPVTVEDEIKPEVKPEDKPETNPEENPVANPEAKPEGKPETNPEAKPEVKPETKPEVQDEIKSGEKQLKDNKNDAKTVARKSDNEKLENKTGKESKEVKTGDNNQLPVVSFMLFGSILGLAVVLRRKFTK